MDVALVKHVISSSVHKREQQSLSNANNETEIGNIKKGFSKEVLMPIAMDMNSLPPKLQEMADKIQRHEKYGPMVHAAAIKQQVIMYENSIPFAEDNIRSAVTPEDKSMYQRSLFETMSSISKLKGKLQDTISHALKYSYGNNPDLKAEIVSGTAGISTLEDAAKNLSKWRNLRDGTI